MFDTNYDFPVAKKNIQVCGGRTIPNLNAIVREDTGEVMTTVTDRYKISTHTDVVNTFEEALDASGSDFKRRNIVTRLPKNGARMFRKYSFPDIKVTLDEKDHVTGKPDEINMTLELRNSYDGTIGIGYQCGAFRWVCSNGLFSGEMFSQLAKKHTLSFEIDDMVAQFQEAPRVLERNVEIWNGWKDIEIPVMDAKDFIAQTKTPEKFQEQVLKQYELEEMTKFGLYQAVTNVITHTTKARNENDTRANQVKLEEQFTPLFFN